MTVCQQQAEILRVIGRYIELTGESPTVREIHFYSEVGSLAQVMRQLAALRDAGLITWRARKRRSIRIVSLTINQVDLE